MEILIRISDGRIQIQTPETDRLRLVGALELVKAQILSQPGPPAVQAPPPGLADRLLNGRG